MRYFLALSLFCICLLSVPRAHAQEEDVSAKKQEIEMNDQLTQRGTQLRTEIDKTYQELSAARALNTTSGNDITPIVIKYIPVGTSFDDAENILRAAGFKVEPRPNANTPNNGLPSRYDVVGSINPYTEKFLSSKTAIYINLSPASPSDYSNVSKVSGGIVISYL